MFAKAAAVPRSSDSRPGAGMGYATWVAIGTAVAIAAALLLLSERHARRAAATA